LIKKVINGEEVIIVKGNISLVKMVGVGSDKPTCTLGSAHGLVKISDDFKEYTK